MEVSTVHVTECELESRLQVITNDVHLLFCVKVGRLTGTFLCSECQARLTTMAVLTFKNPPYSQIASPLLQLPTEVLLIILRLLHLSPTGIVKSEGANYSLTYNLNVQLSSQLLRCCQRLHLEGGRVLYTGNTLNITFGLRGDKHDEDHGLVHCFMFDTAIQIPQHGLEIPQDQFDLLS